MNGESLVNKCVILMGGSFDPVHLGHLTIAKHFCQLFQTPNLRLIPAGNPWQKTPLIATPSQRIEMLKLAFEETALSLSIKIDDQEIRRQGPSYSIETLENIRKELGKNVSLIFIIGIDQLLNLHTWYQWKKLFKLAHLAVAMRPGFTLTPSSLSLEVKDLFLTRLALPEEIKQKSCGLTYLAHNALIDISATEIRKNIYHSDQYRQFVTPKVLDYITKINLYRN